MVQAGCIFVAGTHPSMTCMSGSFGFVRWNACVHRLDLGLYSHPKEIWGNGVRTHVKSKGKLFSTGKILPRGGSNPRRCIKQDSEPNTVPTSFSSPSLKFQICNTQTIARLIDLSILVWHTNCATKYRLTYRF